MPLTRQEATTLAAFIHELRPAWDTAGILATLKKCAHRPEHAGHIAQAFIRAAIDPEARTPAGVIARMSYWNLDHPTTPPRVVLTPEHECQRHPGQWAATCSLCAGEAKGEKDGPEVKLCTLTRVHPEHDYENTAGTWLCPGRPDTGPGAGRGLRAYFLDQARANIAPPPPRRDQPSTNPANLTHNGGEPASSAPERTPAP